jgi:iron complex outermembrane receptor protein
MPKPGGATAPVLSPGTTAKGNPRFTDVNFACMRVLTPGRKRRKRQIADPVAPDVTRGRNNKRHWRAIDMSHLGIWVRALLGAGALGSGAVAMAQSSAPTQNALEEIVVTAEKRAAGVQDVPISISALSGDDLAAIGVAGTDALANFTPGLTVQKEVIGKVSIRGIGTENYTVGSDPGVAIHKDGVYIARSAVSIFEFFDVSRVEVLRGPQGTLYGRNATGGVINILSNEPGREFGGYARLDFGNYAKRRIEGAVNMPFSDTVQGRLSVLYAKRDGFTENVFPGLPAQAGDPVTGYPAVPAITSAAARDVDQLDNQDLWAARAQLRVALGEQGSLLLGAELTRDESLPPAFKYTDTSSAYWFNLFGPDADIKDLRKVSQDFSNLIPGTSRSVPSVGKADLDSFSAKLTWDFGGLTLMSLSAYRKIDFSWINDGDGFDQLFVNYFQTDKSKQFTQELQLSSAGDGPLQWILGAFYLDEKAETFTGIPFLYLVPSPSPALLWDGESNTKAYAVYGQATYSWTDRLRTTLGLRYNKEKKDGQLVYNPFGFLGPNPPAQNLKRSWDAVTPKFGVDFDFTDDVMGYASVTRGFKSGGFNLLAVQEPYNPEYLWSYEAGLKSKFADGRVIANIGAFYYDYKDLQVGKVVNLSATVVNAAKAKIKGVEVELRAAPIDGVELNAGLSFLDTKYKEFVTEDPGFTGNTPAVGALGCGTPIQPNAATPNRSISLAGCRLPRSPKFQGVFGGQWSIPLPDEAQLRLRADYAYRGKQYFTQFNRESVSQDGYGILNARITYASRDDRWSISAYGDNLTNKDYAVTVLESGVAAPGTVVPQSVIGPPRTYGFVATVRF